MAPIAVPDQGRSRQQDGAGGSSIDAHVKSLPARMLFALQLSSYVLLAKVAPIHDAPPDAGLAGGSDRSPAPGVTTSRPERPLHRTGGGLPDLRVIDPAELAVRAAPAAVDARRHDQLDVSSLGPASGRDNPELRPSRPVRAASGPSIPSWASGGAMLVFHPVRRLVTVLQSAARGAARPYRGTAGAGARRRPPSAMTRRKCWPRSRSGRASRTCRFSRTTTRRRSAPSASTTTSRRKASGPDRDDPRRSGRRRAVRLGLRHQPDDRRHAVSGHLHRRSRGTGDVAVLRGVLPRSQHRREHHAETRPRRSPAFGRRLGRDRAPRDPPASQSNPDISVGSRFHLALDITPKPGMHVYAPGAHELGYRGDRPRSGRPELPPPAAGGVPGWRRSTHFEAARRAGAAVPAAVPARPGTGGRRQPGGGGPGSPRSTR